MATALPAQAQEKKQEGLLLVVAVVDMNLVMTEAKAAKSIRDQIEAKRKTYQGEMEVEEKSLREANQELARQRTILSPEAFKEERRKFEERFVAAQRGMQERKMELDRARNDALVKLRDALKEVITSLVVKNNITLILRKDQTVFTAKPMDITALVIEEVDKKLPSVKVFNGKGK
ncbi:MAG: OmpH family outer membrane protein [Rhodospirillales bacterium]|nr:OmpH family outer membrane protein [Rhodospirillales bacterium]MCW8861850.1 OmpH family outer membrane protein [Rhodospirillales bacterium]MCW8953167.1 OmpH family outer membrane protein [Rhodospirillales bacterium]MCW9003170.1 OmpH family outer membrane protein [Rhodospirillales bacterium]MCW9039480.1 OmpH family outer membrane protein [Rhodospirillales bacterium]